MNWVRINTTLPDSAKVIALARLLKCSLNEALGVMLRWLCWLDSHTEDGKSGLLMGEVDDLICGKSGACAALCAIGWVDGDANGYVCAVDFDKYNSPTAKARTLQAARKANQRANKKHNK